MDWKKHNINVAVQVLPESDNKIKYELVDKAIEAIQKSGYRYQVCPFETVVECRFDQLSGLIELIHEACEMAGTEKMLMNLKVQSNFAQDVSVDDKMKKYS